MARLPFLRRVGSTFAAQIYNQVVGTGVQLVQVPLLLVAWGADRYGGWLVLYAIPSYLTLSDFGFTLIAKNDMVIRAAGGDRAGVTRIYHSVFALLLAVVAVLGVLAVVGVEAVSWRRVVDLGPISETTARIVLLSLVANVLVNQFFLLFCAGVRASGRPAAEVVWGASARLLEGGATVSAAAVSTDVAHAALAILATRLVCVVGIGVWLRVVAADIRLGLTEARFETIRAMLNPSLSYSLLGLAQALAIQGPVLILGAVATAHDTAMFSTSRTLARLGTSGANLVNYSVGPEYSRLHGAGDTAGFAHLKRIHVAIGITGIVLYGVGLWWFGPWILSAWTHGEIAAVYPFFGLLNAAVAAEMFWGGLFTPLAAINRHVRLSWVFVGLTLLLAVPTCLLAVSGGATAIAAMLLVLHGAMCVLVVTLRR